MMATMSPPDTRMKSLSCADCKNAGGAWAFTFSMTETIAPKVMGSDDESAFVCPICDRAMNDREAQRLRDWMDAPCGGCGHVFDMDNIALNVSPLSAPLLDKNEVKQRTWFHATNVQDWLSAVTEAKAYVHLGSRDSALERESDIYHNQSEEWRKENPTTSFLWEITIKPGAVVSDDVMPDENKWFSTVSDCTTKHLGGDVQRYLNRWESAGSISLLADPSQIESVKVTQIRNSATPST